MKRSLALILALVLVCSMIPVVSAYSPLQLSGKTGVYVGDRIQRKDGGNKLRRGRFIELRNGHVHRRFGHGRGSYRNDPIYGDGLPAGLYGLYRGRSV